MASRAPTLQVGTGDVTGWHRRRARPVQCVTIVPKVGDNAAKRREAPTSRSAPRLLIRAGLSAKGRNMASSRKQVVNTDVTTLQGSAAETAPRPAPAHNEPASATRIQAVAAQHLQSFDAELGRTQPSL
jgi:hypothetical protein